MAEAVFCLFHFGTAEANEVSLNAIVLGGRYGFWVKNTAKLCLFDIANDKNLRIIVSMRNKLLHVGIVFVVFGGVVHAQTENTAKDVYKRSEQSVFLIYLNNSSGEHQALGSGFLIAPRKIATNAHVADAGSPVISVGQVLIPAKIEKVDDVHDLAILDVDVDLTSAPLKFSLRKLEPGETVYAIGNPEGLEKTFSQGIVSALRAVDGNDLIQITNPISHGSSGGPVLDSDGNVIGVTVASFKDGQNLNFSVPIRFLDTLLRSNAKTPLSEASLDSINALVKKINDEDYSSDEGSPFSKDLARVKNLAVVALTSSDPNFLVGLSRAIDVWDNDDSLAAAEKANLIKSSAQASAALGGALVYKGIFDSNKDSMKQEYSRAVTAEERAIALEKFPTRDELCDLAYSRENLDQPAEAYQAYQKSLTARNDEWPVGTDVSLRGLIRNAATLKKINERKNWFGQLVSTGVVSSSDYDDEADRRMDENDYAIAGDFYEKSAALSKDGFDYCPATVARRFQLNLDKILADGRECLTRQIEFENKKPEWAKRVLPMVNVDMANALNQRGVYTQALNYAREASKEDAGSYQAYDEMADAFYYLQRYQESVSAETEAIRLSDGKFGYMHFRLGTNYYSLEQWKSAETEFEKSAELDQSDDSSTYNLALSLQHEGFYHDAARWYRETLKRNPRRNDREEVLAKIQTLSQ